MAKLKKRCQELHLGAVFAECQILLTSFSYILLLCVSSADRNHMMLGHVGKRGFSKWESCSLNRSADHISFNKVYESGINNYTTCQRCKPGGSL